MGIISAGLLSERRWDVRGKKILMKRFILYVLTYCVMASGNKAIISVVQYEAEKCRAMPLSLLIDIILQNDNKLKEIYYSHTILIFYTLFTMNCSNCSLPKEENLTICLLISIL